MWTYKAGTEFVRTLQPLAWQAGYLNVLALAFAVSEFLCGTWLIRRGVRSNGFGEGGKALAQIVIGFLVIAHATIALGLLV